ncbi:MAG: AAA family ATPase [Pirellulales bacterium]
MFDLDAVEPSRVTWLYRPFLARGKLHLLVGYSSVNKSTLMCALAATISTGGFWPSGERMASRGSVLLIGCEDDKADTLVPRLQAAGADLKKIKYANKITIAEKPEYIDFSSSLHRDVLRNTVDVTGDLVAIFVDPIVSFMGRRRQ